MHKLKTAGAAIVLFALGLVGAAAFSAEEPTVCDGGHFQARHYTYAWTEPGDGDQGPPGQIVAEVAKKLGLSDYEIADNPQENAPGQLIRVNGKDAVAVEVGTSPYGQRYLASVSVCLDATGGVGIDALDDPPTPEPGSGPDAVGNDEEVGR